MAIPSSLSLDYDAVLSTTLFKIMEEMAVDNISTANAAFYYLNRRGAYRTVSTIGDRMQVPLMYELGSWDTYSNYDQLDVTPADGVTSAFFDWGQSSVPVVISGLEKKKNRGEAQIMNLLTTKSKQALMGIKEGFNKAFLQGNGPNTATEITTKYTSPTNGAQFIDPLPLLVKYDPTSSTSIGNINQSTYSWWQNQTKASSSTSYAAFLKELDNLYNLCSKGTGGSPDLHITDMLTWELYCAALRAQHRNPSFMTADIPFRNVGFYGNAVVWDEFVPDAANGTIASIPVAASGTWYMLNSEFMEIQVDSETNFSTTPFVTPENQDASVAQILWLGGIGVSNRRKHGVMGSIATTTAS